MIEAFTADIDRDLVVVRGPDATSFLQSLVSQDLDAVGVGETAPSLLLQPQGKLLVSFLARHAAPDEWHCLCEAGFGPVLSDGLNRFKIRVKADIDAPEVAALAVRGADVPADGRGCELFLVAWGSAPAFDAVGPADAVENLRTALALPAVDSDAYEEARIEAGVPRMGVDVDDRTIPQEAGLEQVAVSFTKGCFVGQELVCRIDNRGHVNRHLRRLRPEGGVLVPAMLLRVDGRSVGEVTSAVTTVALAMVRREVDPGATVEFDGGRAIVEAI